MKSTKVQKSLHTNLMRVHGKLTMPRIVVVHVVLLVTTPTWVSGIRMSLKITE